MGRPSHDPAEESRSGKVRLAIDVEEMDPSTETAVPLGALLPLRRQTGSSQPLKGLTSPLQARPDPRRASLQICKTRPDSCCRPDDDAAGPEVIGESATRGFSSPAERLNISVREVGGRVHGRQRLGRDADGVRFATHLCRLAAQALADQRVAEHPERVGLISEHLAGDLVLPADRHALLPVFPFCHASGPRLARHRAETAECPARGRAMSLEDSETRARPGISHG
jgi:hypothetical protein